MSERIRKTFTPAFKAKVALEAIRGVKTANEIAQEYGVHPVQTGQRKRAITEQAGALVEATRGRKAGDDGMPADRLYSEIGRLKMELDWLKKKSGVSP